MKRITELIARLGLTISTEPASDDAITARLVLLKDKKNRAFLTVMHPDTELSTKLLSTRLGCGKNGVAEATGALAEAVFGSASSGAVTLGCVMDCPHAVAVLLDQELKTEFWVGAAHGQGSIFLDGTYFHLRFQTRRTRTHTPSIHPSIRRRRVGVHVAELLNDRSIETIDFAANPKITRDSPPDLKAFADALEPLPQELVEKAEAAEKEGAEKNRAMVDEKKAGDKKKGVATDDAHAAAKAVLDVDALADLLIAQISAIPRDDAEAQRRAKLDIASRLNQLRNAAYAAGFAARK